MREEPSSMGLKEALLPCEDTTKVCTLEEGPHPQAGPLTSGFPPQEW